MSLFPSTYAPFVSTLGSHQIPYCFFTTHTPLIRASNNYNRQRQRPHIFTYTFTHNPVQKVNKIMNINLVSVGGGESLVAPLLVSPSSPTSTQHRHHHSAQYSHSSSPPPSSPSLASGRIQHQKQKRQEQHFTGITSIPVRLIQQGLSILFRIRAALPATLRPWFWVGLWLVFLAIGVGIFAGFHTKIFQLLEAMATIIKGLGRA